MSAIENSKNSASDVKSTEATLKDVEEFIRTHDQRELIPFLGTFEDFMTPEEFEAMRGRDSGYLKPEASMTLLERITTRPNQMGGKPCIRGMRIPVADVLGLLAHGMSSEQILRQLPDLEMDDIRASLEYAARELDHPQRVPA